MTGNPPIGGVRPSMAAWAVLKAARAVLKDVWAVYNPSRIGFPGAELASARAIGAPEEGNEPGRQV